MDGRIRELQTQLATAQVQAESLQVERDIALARALAAEQQVGLSQDLALRFERELDEQRQSVARELQDELGRHATALRTLAATFEHRLAATEPSLAQLATLMIGNADALIDAIRTMIHRVRPQALDSGGLLTGLRALIDDWRLRRADLRFELLQQPADDARFGLGDPAVESLAWRIVDEAMAEAIRGGSLRMLVVSVRTEDGRLTVQVGDDADGGARARSIPPALAAIGERVADLGGRIDYATGESGGSELIAVLPWPGAG